MHLLFDSLYGDLVDCLKSTNTALGRSYTHEWSFWQRQALLLLLTISMCLMSYRTELG